MATYYHPGIADHLAAQGLDVEVVPGWETRGVRNLSTGARMPFNPRGALSHWTAGPRTGERPSLNVCLKGRPGIPGPLCNVFLGRESVVLVAAGRANHAGAGSIRGLTSASQLWGTEAEDSGRNEWTDFQRWAYPRINAAYSTYSDFDETWHFSHAEYATPRGRKVDINGYTMDDMRAQVRALLRGGPVAPAPAAGPSARPDVEVQLALAVLGLYDAGTDGKYLDGVNGGHQRAAVINYQRTRGLQVDGWWGPNTDKHFERNDMASIVKEIADEVLSRPLKAPTPGGIGEGESLATKVSKIRDRTEKTTRELGATAPIVREIAGRVGAPVDAEAVAKHLAPLVTAALIQDGHGASTDAIEAALRRVFADAGKED